MASEPAVEDEVAVSGVLAGLAADAVRVDVPDLVYVVTEDSAHLAWSAEVAYTGEAGEERRGSS